MDRHRKGGTCHGRGWNEIPNWVYSEPSVEADIDSLRRSDQEESIAIRSRIRGRLRSNIAVRARPVLDNDLLAEPLRQPWAYQTRSNVMPPTRRETNNQTHRPRRIGLRPRNPRQRWQRGNASGPIQKLSAVGKFHGADPS